MLMNGNHLGYQYDVLGRREMERRNVLARRVQAESVKIALQAPISTPECIVIRGNKKESVV